MCLLGLRALGQKGRVVGLRKPATAAKRLLGLRALSRRGWAAEPELEVEVARSPFELWASVSLTGKQCRMAELQPDPRR